MSLPNRKITTDSDHIASNWAATVGEKLQSAFLKKLFLTSLNVSGFRQHEHDNFPM